MQATDRCNLTGWENDSFSPAALQAVRDARPEHLSLHGDTEHDDLRQAIAGMHRVDPDRVFLSAGATDAIQAAFDVFGPSARTIGLLKPDWPGFSGFAKRTRASVVTHDQLEFPHHFDVTEIVRFCNRGRVDLIALSNPSAITGRYLRRMEIADLVRRAPNTMFIIDEAMSIHPEASSMSLANPSSSARFGNVVFVGSLSSYLGLSGLRLGYIAVPDRLRRAFTSRMSRVRLINLALMAGRAAIADVDYQMETQLVTLNNLFEVTSALTETPYSIAPGSQCFAGYVSADDGVEDPYDSLARRCIDLAPGSLFGLKRGARLNLRSKSRTQQLIAELRELSVQPDHHGHSRGTVGPI